MDTQFGFTIGNVAVGVFVLMALTVLTHIAFAIGVHDDVGRRSQRGLETKFGGVRTWVLATLALGIIAVMCYWVVHYSSFSRDRGEDSTINPVR